MSQNPQNRNQFPPERYPQDGAECWALGGQWYQEWYYKQDAVHKADEDARRIGPAAQRAQDAINREVSGSQQQRALVRQYGTVIEEYRAARQILDRDTWLRRSMKGLGGHMKLRAMIYRDDLPTFPLDIDA